ncbi:MAG: helix-hairpin-helix domain-containing protein [Pontiellaceae bacterium]
MNQLNGHIEKIVFHSDESGFCVLRIKSDEHNDLVTLTGTASSVNDGEWIAADGEWINDPSYGKQFKSSELRIAAPDTLEGIEKYLASDLVKGIGKEYASRLVNAFGKDVFNVIEKNSGKLLKVEGIGKTRKENIKEAWDEQKSVRKIMSFLFSSWCKYIKSI